MSIPTNNTKRMYNSDPLIRSKVWLKANTFRTSLEGKLIFARELEAEINGNKSPNPHKGAFALDWLVEAAVFLDMAFFGKASAEAQIASLNAAARRGLMLHMATRTFSGETLR